MVQNIIIALIVLVCALYVGRKFYRQFKGTESGCGCECSGCDSRMSIPTVKDGCCQGSIQPKEDSACGCAPPKGDGKKS